MTVVLMPYQSFSAAHLMTAPTKENPLGAPQLTGEALVKQLLDRQASCAVRIVPVRNTDFGVCHVAEVQG